jgi:hypothetical protein
MVTNISQNFIHFLSRNFVLNFVTNILQNFAIFREIIIEILFIHFLKILQNLIEISFIHFCEILWHCFHPKFY